MIVGNGLIAKALQNIDSPTVVFIAAGVSDSHCKDEKEFLRERALVEKILAENPNRLIVFFSTYSIYDSSLAETDYVKHKIELENLISRVSKKYLIARVSNLVGNGGNPKTVFNFLFNNITEGNKFILWKNASRNFILIEDFVILLNYIINNELSGKQRIFDVVNRENIKIIHLVKVIEQFLKKDATYELIERVSHSKTVDQRSIERFQSLIPIDEDYTIRMVKSYCEKFNIL